jgi:hypothetical protein
MVKSGAAKIRDFWLERVPFTFAGFLLLLGSLSLVGFSIPNQNVYGITVGSLESFF